MSPSSSLAVRDRASVHQQEIGIRPLSETADLDAGNAALDRIGDRRRRIERRQPGLHPAPELLLSHLEVPRSWRQDTKHGHPGSPRPPAQRGANRLLAGVGFVRGSDDVSERPRVLHGAKASLSGLKKG